MKCYQAGREVPDREVEMKLSVSRVKTGDDDNDQNDARTLTLTTMHFNQRGAVAELFR